MEFKNNIIIMGVWTYQVISRLHSRITTTASTRTNVMTRSLPGKGTFIYVEKMLFLGQKETEMPNNTCTSALVVIFQD
jgi:hypothetical protein